MKLMEKLKAEQAKLAVDKEKNTGGQFKTIPWYKTEAGKNFLRIVPGPNPDKDGEPVLWKEALIHFGLPIQKKDGSMVKISARCLKDLGEDCPMCNKYDALIEAGDKDKAKQIRPATRYFYNVLNYKNGKVEVLSAGTMIHSDVMQLIDLGCDFWDVKEGLDLKLVKEVDPSKPAQFGTSYKLMPAKVKVTAIPSKLLPELENTTDLDEVYADNLGDKMVEAFGGTVSKKAAPKKKAAAPKKEEAKEEEEESYYEEDEKAEETKVETATGDDDDLDKELEALGL